MPGSAVGFFETAAASIYTDLFGCNLTWYHHGPPKKNVGVVSGEPIKDDDEHLQFLRLGFGATRRRGNVEKRRAERRNGSARRPGSR